MNSNTRQRRFLCRQVMSVRLRKHLSEFLLGMGSYQLQTFARSLGAQSAISIPAGTGRRGRPFRCMYIYLSKYLYETVAINVLYACEAHNFAPWLRLAMRPLPQADLER